jgi:hypothetical protein
MPGLTQPAARFGVTTVSHTSRYSSRAFLCCSKRFSRSCSPPLLVNAVTRLIVDPILEVILNLERCQLSSEGSAGRLQGGDASL